MRPIVVLAILSFITWMSSAHALQEPVSGCCPGLSNTRVLLEKIKNYTMQGVCPVKAIVFQTEGGLRLCSDPESNWAKKAKLKVDEDAKRLLEMEQNTQASPSDFETTVPTTTKKSMVKVDEEAKGLLEMEQNTQASTSDPESNWAKKAKVKVDEEAKRLLEMEQNTQASTSDFPSTVPTTTKKAKVKVDEEAKQLPEMEQNSQASTSDPESDWAKKATVKVDEEAEGLLEMEQNTQASTSDFPSTVPTTTKKAPVKRGRKGRRGRRRRWLKFRGGRRGKRFLMASFKAAL